MKKLDLPDLIMKELDIPELFRIAKKSSRDRKTFSPKDPSYTGCRYMVNALFPKTYVQPHKHPEKGANELWIVLKGIVTPVLFSETGEIIKAYDISYEKEIPFIEIPENTFHTLLVKNIPSVVLEVSRGPYNPETYKEFATWAPPEEDTKKARKYLINLEKRLKERKIIVL